MDEAMEKKVFLDTNILIDYLATRREMMTRTPHIINVKDAKKVAFMFGGLDIIYTYIQT